MESHDQEKIDYSFLLEDDSKILFGKLDYLLKDGMHIQQFNNTSKYMPYLKLNYKHLKHYYQELFGVSLERKGFDNQLYYYLNYHSKEQAQMDESHKYQLKNEDIIIGCVMYKIIYLDGNVELNSISDLKKKVSLDYEEYEEGLIRLIAKSKEGEKLKEDDGNIDEAIDRALRDFKKLGWVDYEKDHFELLPSFERILLIYEDVIKDIDNLIKKYQ